jgi:hypothetical protein
MRGSVFEHRETRPDRVEPVQVLALGEGYATTKVNTTLFRHHGLVTQGDWQFGAFYVSSEEITIVRRDLRDDTISRGTIIGSFKPADMHNCISLGLDANGYVHIAYDHHGNPLNYRRSLHPFDVTAWTDPLAMTGKLEDRVTYPQFLMCPGNRRDEGLSGRLLFLYRHLGSSNGDICLKEYDPESQTWSDTSERFVKGMDQQPWTSNAYWDHPSFDSRGNLMLSWVWRVVQNASAKGDFIFNHNHGFARSPDGRRWFTSHGVELSLPMTQVNSEIVWPTTPGATIGNMCSSAVDSQDRPHIVGYGADSPDGVPQYRHIWFDGSGWQCQTLSERTEPFGLLVWNVPMSRPEILIDRDDSVYVIYRCDITEHRLVAQRLEPPNYEPPGTILKLWPEDLGRSEPIVDRVRWARDGVLSMLVQRAAQPDQRAKQDLPPEQVSIVDWRLSGCM